MIARLYKKVFIKNAFTDKIVFKTFVKDIIGIKVDPVKIEIENPLI